MPRSVSKTPASGSKRGVALAAEQPLEALGAPGAIAHDTSATSTLRRASQRAPAIRTCHPITHGPLPAATTLVMASPVT